MNKTIYYIIGAFVSGMFLLVYIEYNSSKNINQLILSNEKMIDEFAISMKLNELEKNVLAVESKVRGVITTNDITYIEGLESNITEIKNILDKLQKISGDDSSLMLIDKLDTLVDQKIRFNRKVLDRFSAAGKSSAELLVATKTGKQLTDSIIQTTLKIDYHRKRHVTTAAASIDQSGRRAQQFSIALIVLVILSATGLFWYILKIIIRQVSLIQQLNISEKKVKESAELKEKFLANMSHEIRTPMNAILGFTNLLQRKHLDPEAKDFVQTIQRSGENLLSIINDILDLSKIEAGMMRIEAVPFSMRGLVHSIEMMFKAKSDEKQLSLNVQVDPLLPDRLEGDATRLTQILVNLIGNAIKFTNRGGISINISLEGQDGKTIRTAITISDTGIGIDRAKLGSIFERFQQAEDSVTRNYGGTGLGLSIVQDLVLLQNGTISVDSELGKGTTFYILLPYQLATDHTLFANQFDTPVALTHNFEGIRVLVVEDNEINQSLIYHLFNSWQLKYDLVKNGLKAVNLLRTNTYDLILMDIQMPEMDGYTATQEIRRKLKIDTPIIAMTAHALAGEKEKCLSFGMNDYISKPIKEDKLHQLIIRFTDTRDTTPELTVTASEFTKHSPYSCIQLDYMKAVSNGNTDYEKTVTRQFIEAIPVELEAIQNAWQQQRIDTLRHIAHNMRTTVSVMGLNERLQCCLDALEYEQLNDAQFDEHYQTLRVVCHAALQEATIFYSTI